MRNSVPVEIDDLKHMFKGISVTPVTRSWSKLNGVTLRQGDTILDISISRDKDPVLELHTIEEGEYTAKFVVVGTGVQVALDCLAEAEELRDKLEELGFKPLTIQNKRIKTGK